MNKRDEEQRVFDMDYIQKGKGRILTDRSFGMPSTRDRGGKTTEDNCQLLCEYHNKHKSDT